jgi:predicted metal-dependent HD superfamily phosphohydrolase
MNKSILKEAEKYIRSLYEADDKKNLLYHNETHAEIVACRVNEIASNYILSDIEIIELNLAAWFHDVGHLYTTPDEHEEKSVEVAESWLKEGGAGADMINAVKELIFATKIFTPPQNLCQQIIKDADTYHFGTKDFKKTDKLLKKEMRLRNFTTMLAVWQEKTLELLQKHEFFTDYCKNLLNEGKRKNIEKIKKKTGETNFENADTPLFLHNEDDHSKEAAKKNSFITKGIQTMLRLTSQNHIRLSELADSKANILISINAIIISLILSILIRKIEVDTHLTIPTFLFLATSVITIVLAIIATRPKVTSGEFSREDVTQGKTNLLFFGNFYKTSLEEYKWAMSMMMRDPNYLYGGLVEDIYYLGVVLGRKYRLLSLAYYIFMVGILVSVVAFVLAILLHQPDTSTTVQGGTGSPF